MSRDASTRNELKRDQVWRRDHVLAVVASALAASRADAARNGLAAALEVLDAAIDVPVGGWADGLARFTAANAALVLCVEHAPTGIGPAGVPVAREAGRYFRVATRALHEAGVDTRRARLRDLHVELQTQFAAAYASVGDEWKDVWRNELRPLGAQAGEATLLVLADRSMRERGGHEAVLRLLEAELRDPSEADLAALRLARARTLRLSGELDESDRVLESVGAATGEVASQVAWERALTAAIRAGGIDEPLRLMRVDSSMRRPERLLLLALWAYATRSKEWMPRASRSATLTTHLAKRAELRPALHALRTLERAYRSDLPLPARVHAVARMVDGIDALPDIGMEALSLAAAGRWLLRAKRPAEAEIPQRRYEELSASLSAGSSRDAFGLQLSDDATARAPTDRPSAPHAAGLSRERLVAGVGMEILKTKARAWIDPEGRDPGVVEYVETLAYHVSVLKGPLMKMGQLLSVHGFGLSDDTRSMLASLHDSATPLDPATIRAVAEADLGGPLERVFRRFDEVALAAGSIGQVHAAELVSGEDVVVKIQYPEMPECIRRDLRCLRLLAPLAKSTLRGWDLSGILTDVEARLHEECDYHREAEAQEALRERLAGTPNVVVPRVLRELSRRRVLVMERFRGIRFAEFAATASQEARDRAGETIFRALLSMVLDGYFTTDIQPGNFLFSGDRICFLDFGSIQRWSGGESEGWRTLLGAVIAQDPEAMKRGLRGLGLVDSTTNADFAAIYRLMIEHFVPALAKDQSDLVVKRETIANEIAILLGSGSKYEVRIPPHQVFAFRAYWGMCAILAALGARFHARRVAMDVLAKPSTG